MSGKDVHSSSLSKSQSMENVADESEIDFFCTSRAISRFLEGMFGLASWLRILQDRRADLLDPNQLPSTNKTAFPTLILRPCTTTPHLNFLDDLRGEICTNQEPHYSFLFLHPFNLISLSFFLFHFTNSPLFSSPLRPHPIVPQSHPRRRRQEQLLLLLLPLDPLPPHPLHRCHSLPSDAPIHRPLPQRMTMKEKRLSGMRKKSAIV